MVCMLSCICQDFGIFWPLEEEELTGVSFVVRYMSESADCSDTYKSSWIIRSFLMESTEVRTITTYAMLFCVRTATWIRLEPGGHECPQ